MRRLIAPVALIVIVTGVVLGWKLLTPRETPRNAAKPFSVKTLDGKTVRLAELRGQPVVLDFWATWCAPCRASMPHLSEMQERYRDQGLVILGLSVDHEVPKKVKGFAERLAVRFPVAMASERVLDDYGPIRSIPTTIFIDRSGRIVRRIVGYVDRETLDGFIREIL